MINANAKVSCVMVTADRIKLCARSVWCYQQQTYSNKELVVLDNGNESMAALLKQLPADEVRYKKINRTPDLVLGDLRNTALNMATGSLIIPQWDDDDWYHPQRIQRQVEILEQGHDACALAGTLMHVNQHPFTDRPYIGLLRNGVPPTIMHRRDDTIRYPSLPRTEDTVYVNAWLKKSYVQLPEEASYLYIRAFHGANTWEVDHFLRRMRNTPTDSLRFAWYKYVRRNLFAHPRFQLTAEMQAAFAQYIEDSRRLEIF